MSATRLDHQLALGSLAARYRPLALALRNILVGPVAAIFLMLMLWLVLRGTVPAFDFRFAYSAAGHRVLTGHSPYLWTPAQFRDSQAFVYPALSALLFAPLSLIPQNVGVVLFTLVCVGLVPATLWLLHVRDWRVYGISFLWMPVYSGWMTANESLFLMLGLACLCRWREHPIASGLLTALMISLKPLMWPLALWMLATRRWRGSAYMLVCGLALNLVAWGVVGFDQISAYVRAARTDAADSWRTGFGVPAILGHFGLGRSAGIAVMLVLSVLLVAAVVYSGYVRGDELQALTLTVALALVSSPLLWGHYVVLLLVPLALLRPRLDWVWALPVLMWVAQPAAPVHTWQEIVVWCAVLAMVGALTRQRRDARQLEPAT